MQTKKFLKNCAEKLIMAAALALCTAIAWLLYDIGAGGSVSHLTITASRWLARAGHQALAFDPIVAMVLLPPVGLFAAAMATVALARARAD